jgi:hypothetical protein
MVGSCALSDQTRTREWWVNSPGQPFETCLKMENDEEFGGHGEIKQAN